MDFVKLDRFYFEYITRPYKVHKSSRATGNGDPSMKTYQVRTNLNQKESILTIAFFVIVALATFFYKDSHSGGNVKAADAELPDSEVFLANEKSSSADANQQSFSDVVLDPLEQNVRIAVGLYYERLAQYQDAENVYVETLLYALKEDDYRSQSLAQAHLGRLYRLKGEYNKAHDTLLKALNIFHALNANLQSAGILTELAKVYDHWGDFNGALSHYREALDIYKSLEQPYPLIEHYIAMGAFLEKAGEHKEALHFFDLALSLENEIGREALVFYLHDRLSQLYFQQRLWQDSIELSKKTLNYSKRNQDFEATGRSLERIANAYVEKKSYKPALKYYKKAIKLFDKHNDKESLARQETLIGDMFRRQGKLDDAFIWVNKSFASNKALEFPEGLAINYQHLGQIYLDLSDLDNALKYFDLALVTEQKLGRINGVAKQYFNLGLVHRQRRDYVKSTEYFNRSLAIHEELGWDEGVAQDFWYLGFNYQRIGEREKAREYFLSAIQLFEALGENERADEVQFALSQL